MTRRIVLSGGPGVGKTTILDALAKIGMRIAPDAARAVIKERKNLGLSPRPSPIEFSREVFERDILSYKTATKEKPTFFERGVIDSVASLRATGVISLSEAFTLIQQYPYSQPAFVFPPWPEIYRTDTERDQTYTESVKTYNKVVSWYIDHDYTVCEVPKGSVEIRTKFILREIGFA